mmetsp:Transcript_16939/g.43193  ORF Transcript_16939/g.43193 Transcript_16939/m.43193 type:complete len:159 (-) Transcript_16939:138-614(-)
MFRFLREMVDEKIRHVIVGAERTMLFGLLFVVPCQWGVLYFFSNSAAEGTKPCQGLYHAMIALSVTSTFSLLAILLDWLVDTDGSGSTDLDCLGISFGLVILTMVGRTFMASAVCGLLMFTDFEGACSELVFVSFVFVGVMFLSLATLAWRIQSGEDF